MCEFSITDEKCYFCGQPKVVRFNEHYTFCPNCAAIYTYLMIQKSNCKHIKDGIPLLIHMRWVKKDIKPYIYEEQLDDGEIQRCSICGKICIADGW